MYARAIPARPVRSQVWWPVNPCIQKQSRIRRHARIHRGSLTHQQGRTRGGNRIGAVLWNNKVQSVIEPRSGRNQVLHLAKEMLRPPGGPAESTDLARLGSAALASIRRRSLVFVISDFVSEPGWERPLAMLARRHEVIALRIVDPAETELPNLGLMVVQDSETGEQLFVDTSDPGLRHRFAQAAADRETMIAECARRAHMDLHAISTDDDLVRSIIAIARARKQRRR